MRKKDARTKAWFQQYRDETTNNVYELTEREKIAMGLIKKPKVLKDMVHIVIPEHYHAEGVIWQSRFIPEAELEWYKAQYPNMQIVEKRSLMT